MESGLEEQQGISHGLCCTFDLPYLFLGPLDFNREGNLFSGHKEVCCNAVLKHVLTEDILGLAEMDYLWPWAVL